MYSGVLDAIKGTRRILVILSALIGLAIFHNFLWFATWDLARLSAGTVILEHLNEVQKSGGSYLDTPADDAKVREKVGAKQAALSERLLERQYKLPLVNLEVSVADFPVALLLLAVGNLLWLLVHLHRMTDSLEVLTKRKGYECVALTLRHHFVLVGAHARWWARAASRALLFGMPVFGLSCILSDVIDAREFASQKVMELAFNSSEFVYRLALRVGIDTVLTAMCWALAWLCQREYVVTENKVLQELQEGDADQARARDLSESSGAA